MRQLNQFGAMRSTFNGGARKHGTRGPQVDFNCIKLQLNIRYTGVQGAFYSGSCGSILYLFWGFSLHFDIRS